MISVVILVGGCDGVARGGPVARVGVGSTADQDGLQVAVSEVEAVRPGEGGVETIGQIGVAVVLRERALFLVDGDQEGHVAAGFVQFVPDVKGGLRECRSHVDQVRE